jgi:hypothetical protein
MGWPCMAGVKLQSKPPCFCVPAVCKVSFVVCMLRYKEACESCSDQSYPETEWEVLPVLLTLSGDTFKHLPCPCELSSGECYQKDHIDATMEATGYGLSIFFMLISA